MAHELRTPVAGIKQALGNTFRRLARSIFTLTKATFSKEDIPQLEQQLTVSVKEIQTSMGSAERAIGLMSLQLANVSNNKIDDRHFTTCSMATVVKDALDNFFFTGNQHQLIHYLAH